jgi:pimeloyl-ACP methyl ester carboxylesterase
MFATSFDGVPIHYDVAGLGGPALVFVHGWSCDRTYWERQMEAFQSDHMVVAVDLAGHGDSGFERQTWSMEAFGSDVASVIEKLDLNEAILIGHSMGGSVLLEAERIVPSRVSALIAVDTFFDVEMILSQAQADQFLQPFRLDFRSTTRNYVTGYMFTPDTDASLKEAIATDMSLAPPEVAIESLEHLVMYDTPSALKKIGVPIHCINSDKYATRVQTARQYAPSFDVSILSGVSHFLMMEKPGAFNRLLEEVIDKLTSGAHKDPSDKGLDP